MDYEKEIQRLKEIIKSYEKLIAETTVPIIPSIVDNTLLIPVVGHLVQERFHLIQTHILNYIGKHRGFDRAVFDFSAVNREEVASLDYHVLAVEIGQLNASLKLMGVRPIYVGFNPQLVREIVSAGVHVDIETFVNFKTALAELLRDGEGLHSL
ncbi:STAS domain-containing protein [Sporosarcina sp. 179-K 3D1 HS]|uniref:STAS domain-containing protein n=1 Tax=Sporosarcina sp. 179-K 3D1 HS TaxID=3232169 RepID=UPI00399F7B7D